MFFVSSIVLAEHKILKPSCIINDRKLVYLVLPDKFVRFLKRYSDFCHNKIF